MEDLIFDITVDAGDQHYEGWVNPFEKITDKGTPVSFHKVLNDVSFGYLSYGDCQWTINEARPVELVPLVGEEIEKHYLL